MKFQQHYSGSKANLYIVHFSTGQRLLLECGVTWPKLQESLKFDLQGILGCFVTHEHMDHCKAINDVMDAGIDAYTSMGTFEALREIHFPPIAYHRRAKMIADKTLTRLTKDIGVLAFKLNHDAAEPLGFVIREGGDYLLFAPETNYIVQKFNIAFQIIAIECSFDKDTLTKRVKSGEINETLAKRLLYTHMSKQTAMDYLDEHCDMSKCQEIHLIHMSNTNIDDRQKIANEFENRFFIETKVI